jgi:hypothetical protein
MSESDMTLDLVSAARAVLKAAGLEGELRTTPEMSLLRCEQRDRRIEILFRSGHWTISYFHIETKKSVRWKGTLVTELEQALEPLCRVDAFEPARDQSRYAPS